MVTTRAQERHAVSSPAPAVSLNKRKRFASEEPTDNIAVVISPPRTRKISPENTSANEHVDSASSDVDDAPETVSSKVAAKEVRGLPKRGAGTSRPKRRRTTDVVAKDGRPTMIEHDLGAGSATATAEDGPTKHDYSAAINGDSAQQQAEKVDEQPTTVKVPDLLVTTSEPSSENSHKAPQPIVGPHSTSEEVAEALTSPATVFFDAVEIPGTPSQDSPAANAVEADTEPELELIQDLDDTLPIETEEPTKGPEVPDSTDVIHEPEQIDKSPITPTTATLDTSNSSTPPPELQAIQSQDLHTILERFSPPRPPSSPAPSTTTNTSTITPIWNARTSTDSSPPFSPLPPAKSRKINHSNDTLRRKALLSSRSKTSSLQQYKSSVLGRHPRTADWGPPQFRRTKFVT